jgi:hypothetical protein
VKRPEQIAREESEPKTRGLGGGYAIRQPQRPYYDFETATLLEIINQGVNDADLIQIADELRMRRAEGETFALYL